MDSILEYLAARMKEPSTYVSMGVLLTGVGFKIAPEYWESISFVCMSLGGLMGVILQERKKTTATDIKNVVELVVKPSAMDTSQPTKPQLDAAMKSGSPT